MCKLNAITNVDYDIGNWDILGNQNYNFRQ